MPYIVRKLRTRFRVVDEVTGAAASIPLASEAEAAGLCDRLNVGRGICEAAGYGAGGRALRLDGGRIAPPPKSRAMTDRERYKIAHAAGWDAGNASRDAAGRTSWNDDDYNAAVATINRLLGDDTSFHDAEQWARERLTV